MAVHRYWRVLFTAANAATVVGVSEMELLDAGLVDRFNSAYGTVSASSYYVPEALTPAKAADDIAGTSWASAAAPSVGSPQWLKIDFGAVTQYDITRFSLRRRSTTAAWGAQQAPKDFKLQYSDDDSFWSDVIAITNQTSWANSAEKRWFETSGTAKMSIPPPPAAALGTSRRCWRVRSSAADGGLVFALAEIQMRTSTGGANQCSGGSPFEDSLPLEGAAALLINGDLSGAAWWAGATVAEGVGYLFASAKTIVEIALTARLSPNHTQAPSAFY